MLAAMALAWVPALRAEPVVLYTSMPDKQAQVVVAEFTKAHPDIQIVLFREASVRIVAKLQAEKKAGEPGADVLMLADEPSMELVKAEGLHQHIRSGFPRFFLGLELGHNAHGGFPEQHDLDIGMGLGKFSHDHLGLLVWHRGIQHNRLRPQGRNPGHGQHGRHQNPIGNASVSLHPPHKEKENNFCLIHRYSL